MPSENLKGSGKIIPRDTLFHQSWSDEEGDRSLTISRDVGKLFVAIKKEWGGKLEVEISRADAEEIIRCLQRI